MHITQSVTEDLIYLGASDRRGRLFENVYPIPEGVSYNSYLLKDEKTALLDTADKAVSERFWANLKAALGGGAPDWLIISHMEPDHAANIAAVLAHYPETRVLCTAGASRMLDQFFGPIPAERKQIVKEGETLCLGRHTLRFFTAPMVHWPEVMVTFDETDGTLFSADAFGTFGALNGALFADEAETGAHEWAEMLRYYANIVGKYGAQVQALLKKAAGLPVRMICPLHGPVRRKEIPELLSRYDRWSRGEGEGVVIFCGTIYGHTQDAADYLAVQLNRRGVTNVRVHDVSAREPSSLLAEAWRCGTAVFASSSYNAGVFVNMENLLHDLKAHDWKNRKVAYIENGTWAPSAARTMKAILEGQNLTEIGSTVTIRSSADGSEAALDALADAIAAEA